MNIRKVMMLMATLGVMIHCGPKEVPNDDPVVMQGSDTVYGNRNNDEDTMEETTIDSEDVAVYETEDDIDSENLPILEDAAAMDLDWQPVYFEFDKSDLTGTAREKLRQYAQTLQRYPELKVLLEGHCDSRGTEDYNLALGERRAQTVKRFLLELGIANNRLRTISYGELQPQVSEDSERAWALNRRVSFTF